MSSSSPPSPPPSTPEVTSYDYTPERLQRMLADVIARRFPVSDVHLLLRAGADADGPVTRGLRPLHYAAYENDVTSAEALIENGARVNAADDLGYTPLHVAAKHGHFEVAKTLLDNGAAVNFGYEDNDDDDRRIKVVSPSAAQQKTDDADVSAVDEQPSQSGETDSANAASCASHVAGLKTSTTVVTTSCETSAAACLLLTEQPLQLAVENDRRECAELLLSRGADPNRRYFLGRPINLVPLEHVDCLEVLLRNGADPDSVNRAGLTALMCAVKQQNTDAVRVLLHYGADVNIQCPPKFDRRRAIHFAIVVGAVEITRLLLDAGAAVGLAPAYNLTPLNTAVLHDQPEICRILMEYGADPNEINGDGSSTLQLVSATSNLKHQREMVELLLSAGAKPNFASPTFSYVGPSLSALVEYLTYSDSYDYGLVKLFLQYGARVNFRIPTWLLKIRHPGGLLGQLRKLRPHDELLCLLADAADGFDADAISRDNSLSNRQRLMLLDCAVTPRRLRQQCRRAIIESLDGRCHDSQVGGIVSSPTGRLTSTTTTKVDRVSVVHSLPLPTYLKRYLLFDTC